MQIKYKKCSNVKEIYSKKNNFHRIYIKKTLTVAVLTRLCFTYLIQEGMLIISIDQGLIIIATLFYWQ